MINIKNVFILSIVFILFVPIGTISHEYGHIAVARYLGYDTTLHYGSAGHFPKGFYDDKDVIAALNLTKEYRNTAYESWPEDIKEKVKAYNKIINERYYPEESNHSLFIAIGGPLQTMLTGMIGLLILFWRRRLIYKNGLQLLDWLAVFLSLFWLRELFNLVASIGWELISPNGTWFGGDEYIISQKLNLWPGTISIILAAMGAMVAFYVIFKIIPKKIRPTFIISGLIGGISGFILWMQIIGPKIMP